MSLDYRGSSIRPLNSRDDFEKGAFARPVLSEYQSQAAADPQFDPRQYRLVFSVRKVRDTGDCPALRTVLETK
jgi:hypothetical protein